MEKKSMLTEAERRILRGLERATVRHRNPSMREIGEFLDPPMSLSGIRGVLVRLETKGYVEMSVRRARGIKQLQPSPRKQKRNSGT